MVDLFKTQSSKTPIQEYEQMEPSPSVSTTSPEAAKTDTSSVIDLFLATTASINENYVNRRRLLQLKKELTPQLIHLIMDSDFEYGIESSVDVFIRNQIKINRLATKSWLGDIFVEHFGHSTILIGLLRAVSRLSYTEISPEGPIMAVAALSHSNIEVRECGIRAFENWGNLHSLSVLENLQVSPSWLQDYVLRVVQDIRKELNVKVGQENQ